MIKENVSESFIKRFQKLRSVQIRRRKKMDVPAAKGITVEDVQKSQAATDVPLNSQPSTSGTQKKVNTYQGRSFG